MKSVSYLSLWLLFLSVIWEITGTQSVDASHSLHTTPVAQIALNDATDAQASGIAPVLYYLKQAIDWLTLLQPLPLPEQQTQLSPVPINSELNTYIALITYQYFQSSLTPHSFRR